MQIARIKEEECIGCGKCLNYCPVDAILGTPKFLHTVLVDVCIGCKLCLPPCPVDCIELEDRLSNTFSTGKDSKIRAEEAKRRYLARQQRLKLKKTLQIPDFSQDPQYKQKIKNDIKAAVDRVQRRQEKFQKKQK